MATTDKESSAAGTDNRPPMLEESEPLAITTTTEFEVIHEDAYDFDVDEAPHATAAFMANLMQTGPSTRQGTSNDTDFHDLRVDVSLCKRFMASGGGNTSNITPKVEVPKPSRFVGKRKANEQYLEGVNVVDDASKIKMEYVKEFTTRVLEILKLSEQEYLFYFLDVLQGWAKTDTRRDSSKLKDLKVNHEKGGGEKNAQPKVDNAHPEIARRKQASTRCRLMKIKARVMTEAWVGLNAIKTKTEVPKVVGKGLQYVEATINGVKAVNLKAKPIHGVAKDVWAKIGEWEGTIDLSVVPMDDFKVVLGLEFLDKVRAFPMMFANSLCILDGRKTCIVSMEWDAKSGAKTLLAMKKDGSLWMCIDYRALNKVTIKNKYYILLTADLFDQLGKARYFTKLDLRSGYYQVWIAKGDEAKTTCVMRYGSYEFLVIPFGLTNAPVTFCILMNKLFHPFLNKFMVVYLDDIVVYSHTFEEHVLHLKQGHKIKDERLMIDGAKIKAIQDWEPPTKVTELRYFLGLVNYYRRFIMGYSAIASPLMDVLKKNQAWIWDEECQASFPEFEEGCIEEPVLRLPDVTIPFELHTYALDFVIGGV
ncbi:putative nucleotidyltransferase, ribonuclease H [Tanacetum coccineum]